MNFEDMEKLYAVIGKTGLLLARELPADLTVSAKDIPIRVTDVKQAYGRVLYEVRPLSGKGVSWVDATRVKLDEVKK